jgi:hypothetical protein
LFAVVSFSKITKVAQFLGARYFFRLQMQCIILSKNALGYILGVFYKLIWDLCYDFKKYIRRKILRKKIGVFAQTTASFCKKLIITLVLEKKTPIFFAENRRKSQKIVILTSTPGHPDRHANLARTTQPPPPLLIVKGRAALAAANNAPRRVPKIAAVVAGSASG